MIMDVIADVIRSNNFIPADKGLSLSVCAIKNTQGLNRVSINSVWKDLIKKSCIISVENDDNLCLPRAIGIALARCKYMENPSNMFLKRHSVCIRKKDRKRMHKYYTVSLQKQVAVQLQRHGNIPHNKEGVLTHIPLYEKSLGVGNTMILARSGNKKVHNSDKSFSTQIVLYHVANDEGQGHFAVLTKMNALLGRAYYCDDCDMGYNNNTQHRCKNIM